MRLIEKLFNIRISHSSSKVSIKCRFLAVFPEKRGGLGREIEFQSPNQLGACRSDLSTSLKFGVSAATISEIFQVTRSQSAPPCQHTYRKDRSLKAVSDCPRRKDRSLKAVSDCPRKESVAVTRTGKFVSRSLSAFLPYYRDEPSLKSAGIQ